MHTYELQRNVIKDYRKLVVNKFYDRVLLSDECACFEVREQAANANWDPVGCFEQPTGYTMHA